MRLLLLMLLTVLAIGCQEKKDYTLYHQHIPKTVLVLPPINESNVVAASDKMMATITQPVAEMGYYVYPITLVNDYMKDNGLTTPGDMHQAALDKLREVYGADAVLYVTIQSWKTQYLVVNTSTTVKLKYRLVDTRIGQVIWSDERQYTQSSGGSGIVDGMVNAAVQAANNAGTERQVAAQCNYTTLCSTSTGLLMGARQPKANEYNAKR